MLRKKPPLQNDDTEEAAHVESLEQKREVFRGLSPGKGAKGNGAPTKPPAPRPLPWLPVLF